MSRVGQPVRRKHVPQRTCVVCRRVDAKRTLTRVVRTPESGVQIDTSGKLPGRGAYLCDDPACWEKASATGILEAALRTTLTSEDRQRIADYKPDRALSDAG